MAFTLYHNPRCSKSRQTLELLNQRGIEVTVVEYLKNPPSITEIERLLTLLKMHPRDLMRKGEAEYKQQNLDNIDIDKAQLIKAMYHTPKLIERPILTTPSAARIGRPPESVLEIV